MWRICYLYFVFFQAEDGIRDLTVTGVQTCALPILARICLRWFSKPPPSGTRDNGSLDRCRDIEAFDSEPKAWFYQDAETDSEHFRSGVRQMPNLEKHAEAGVLVGTCWMDAS